MQPFTYEAAEDANSAIAMTQVKTGADNGPNAFRYLAGGTTLLDLMKLNVEVPSKIIDINNLANDQAWSGIELNERGLRLGALTVMSEVADNDDIKTNYPVVAQSLMLAASPQLRNMATLGGNVLQRTRCAYFRDVSYTQCNKRKPGSGCAAIDGHNRLHAVLGVNNDCIASYPGDFAQAMIALDARVILVGPEAPREIAFASLHREAGDPARETTLRPGELIQSFWVPAGDFRRSMYLKIRDRQSYAFAISSAAVALTTDGDKIAKSRIALGGVAYRPWRAGGAEAILDGKVLTEERAREAANAAFDAAVTHEHNAFKVQLGKETLVRALLETSRLEI